MTLHYTKYMLIWSMFYAFIAVAFDDINFEHMLVMYAILFVFILDLVNFISVMIERRAIARQAELDIEIAKLQLKAKR